MRAIRALVIAALIFMGLAWILFPVTTRHPSDHTPNVMTNMHQLYVALMIYSQDEGAFPPMHNAQEIRNALYPEEIRDVSLFSDPASKSPILPNPWLSGKKPSQFAPDLKRMIAFYRPSARLSDSTAAIFLDGNAKRLEPKDWQEAKAVSHIP